MSLPRFAVRRPVAVSMAFVLVVLLGIVSLLRMPVALLPDVAFPRLVVWTAVPETGPSQVEKFVTEPIEETLATVPGVRSIESISREGQSLVTLTFPWGTDMEFAQLHVRERLDQVAMGLQMAAERPTILRVDPGAEPILVASATPSPRGGATLADIQTLAATVFRRRLEQLDGVARAAVVGIDEREMLVEVDPARLESHGLSIDDVARALDQASASAPGGTIRRGRYRYAVRALGELAGRTEVAAVVVGHGTGGGTILVSNVATVRDTIAERESAAYFDGRPSVGLLLFKESGSNTVAAAERAVETLEDLETHHRGVELDVVTNQATFVTAAIQNVVAALVLGGLLAFLVLFPFLRDPRWPTSIAVAIPISVVGTFAFLDATGVSLNVMSLGGLALGVGLLVDNSIVVLENVFRHREQGLAAAAAAALGAEEVQGAITASTLTTVAVFGPIVYVEGLAGALFGELALAVAFSLFVSLAVALTLLPAMAARFGAADRVARLRGRLGGALEGFEHAFASFTASYERALGRALDHRREVLGATGAALLLAVLVATILPRDVLPEVDQRAFTARIELPPGTPLEETERTALAMDRWLRARDEVAAVLTRIGRASAVEVEEAQARGRNSAELDVRLRRHGGSTREVMEQVRAAFADLPPGALVLETGAATEIGKVLGTAEPDVSVEIRGASLDTLQAVADEVTRRLARMDRLADVGTTLEGGHPEVRISLDRDAIARHGLEVEQVVRELVDRTRGRVATELAEFDREVPVVVRQSAAERRDLDRILAGTVEGVPLRFLVEVEETAAPTAIERENQRRVVRVTADVAHGSLSGAIEGVEEAVEDLSPPLGVEFAVGGGSDELRRSLRGLTLAFLLALVLVFLILAAQFESLVQPLVVLLAVPLALVGAVFALALTLNGLDTMSGIGIVVLVGIAVNDAIIKVDFINRARADGLSVRVAILEAGRARLRPIVMTSVTTVLGLLPLALGIGSGGELYSPLAIAVIGGMITSTALTLIVVPILYSLVAENGVGPSAKKEKKRPMLQETFRIVQ
jgi:HAE1 family hydrophobic/amphiphilic exporter-1